MTTHLKTTHLNQTNPFYNNIMHPTSPHQSAMALSIEKPIIKKSDFIERETKDDGWCFYNSIIVALKGEENTEDSIMLGEVLGKILEREVNAGKENKYYVEQLKHSYSDVFFHNIEKLKVEHRNLSQISNNLLNQKGKNNKKNSIAKKTQEIKKLEELPLDIEYILRVIQNSYTPKDPENIGAGPVQWPEVVTFSKILLLIISRFGIGIKIYIQDDQNEENLLINYELKHFKPRYFINLLFIPSRNHYNYLENKNDEIPEESKKKVLEMIASIKIDLESEMEPEEEIAKHTRMLRTSENYRYYFSKLIGLLTDLNLENESQFITQEFPNLSFDKKIEILIGINRTIQSLDKSIETKRAMQEIGQKFIAFGPEYNKPQESSRPLAAAASSRPSAAASQSAEWACSFCTYINPDNKKICDMCSRTKEDIKVAAAQPISTACNLCTFESTNRKCKMCGANKSIPLTGGSKSSRKYKKTKITRKTNLKKSKKQKKTKKNLKSKKH